MWTVYVIKSSEGMNYTGMSSNFQKRLEEHNTGQNYYTKRGSNWELVYEETFATAKEARKREQYFKSNAGRKCPTTV